MESIEHIQKEIETLRHELEYYNRRYYLDNVSEISDKAFDAKMERLQALENQFPQFYAADSPSQRVGGSVTKTFASVSHRYPMLSLANTYSIAEVADFDLRVKKVTGESVAYFCEQKFDGVAISLVYENGTLIQAVTRGDGTKGDDITPNARTIRTIPLSINSPQVPAYFEVRGEVYMSHEVFEALNKEKEEAGEEPNANPRNTASGSLKLQDSSEVAKRKLSCFTYQLICEDLDITDHQTAIRYLEQWGFPVSPTYSLCSSFDKVVAYIQAWETKRHTLPLTTDGVVIKVNNYKHREDLGSTAKSPRWAIAYKYQAEQATTTLLSVSYQVGRTGAVTPVANLKPVLLAGTTVKRASLHNANEIARLGLHIPDVVTVEKGGEIIPKVTGVIEDSRPADAVPVVFPSNCPACDTPLVREEGEAAFYCPNEQHCPPQIKGRIAHFIQRKAMEIENLGEETIELLYEKKLISEPADLYALTYDQVIHLERFAEKSALNLLEGIEKSKNMPFENVLFGLGIRFVGRTIAEKLARHFTSMEAIMQADLASLESVPEIGSKIAASVVSYFNNPLHIHSVNRLRAAGLQMVLQEKSISLKSQKLIGKTFLLSGVFASHSREELKQMIEENGGKILSGVTGNLDYLIAGENMGPSKLEKAKKLQIQILDEGQLMEMLAS
jgi:DNA ligase (NAD+)